MKAPSSKPKLIMIGAGMAGTRFLDELIALNHCYDITVFNREPQAGYNRIMLSPVLAGESQLKDIMTHDEEWFVQNDITLYTDKSIVEIEREKKRVIDLDGIHYDFDKLIIATGSKPVVLPIDNTHLDGVVSFRDIQDVEKMQQLAQQKKRAIVIGGGLLGLEAAHGLRMQGMRVSVVHRSEILMNAQLDADTGALLQAELATEKEGNKRVHPQGPKICLQRVACDSTALPKAKVPLAANDQLDRSSAPCKAEVSRAMSIQHPLGYWKSGDWQLAQYRPRWKIEQELRAS